MMSFFLRVYALGFYGLLLLTTAVVSGDSPAGDWRVQLETLRNAAEEASRKGQWEKAASHYAKAIELVESVAPEDEAARNALLRSCGIAFWRNQEYDKAEAALRRILNESREPDVPTQERFEVTQFLGRVLANATKWDEAMAVLRDALQMGKSLGLEGGSPYRDCLVDLSFLYKVKGDSAKAEEYLERAIRIDASPLLLNRQAGLKFSRGAKDEAVDLLQRAIEVNLSRARPSWGRLEASFIGLLKCYVDLDRTDDVATTFDRISAMYQKDASAFRGRTPDLLIRAVAICDKLQDPEQADRLTRLVALQRESKGKGHVDVIVAMSGLAEYHRSQGNRKLAFETLRAAIEEWDSCQHDNDAPVAAVLQAAGSAAWNQRMRLEAEQFTQRALAGFAASASADPRKLADCHSLLGELLARTNDYAQAAVHREQALTLLQKTLPPASRGILNERLHLAHCYINLERWDEAIALLEPVITHCESQSEIQRPDFLVRALLSRARIRDERQEPGEVDDLRRALCIQLDRNISAGTPPSETAIRLATAASRHGRTDQMRELGEKLLAGLPKEFNASDPAAVKTLHVAAIVLASCGHQAAAENAMQQVIALSDAAGTADDGPIAELLLITGQAAYDRKAYVDAECYLKRAVAAYETRGDARARKLGESHSTLGQLYSATGRNDRAVQHMEKAMAILQDHMAPSTFKMLNVTIRLADQYVELDDLDKARPLIESVFERLVEPKDGETATCLASALSSRGRLKKAEGDPAAMEDFHRAYQLQRQHLDVTDRRVLSAAAGLATVCSRFADAQAALEFVPTLLDTVSLSLQQDEAFDERLIGEALNACTNIASKRELDSAYRQRYLELTEQFLDERSRRGLDESRYLAFALRGKGTTLLDSDPEAATEMLLQAWSIFNRTVADDANIRLNWSRALANRMRRAGIPAAQRLPILQGCVALVDQVCSADDPAVVDDRQRLVDALAELKRLDEAEALVHAFLESRKNEFGESHPLVADALLLLGQLQLKQGDTEAGIATYSRAVAAYEQCFGPATEEAVTRKRRASRALLADSDSDTDLTGLAERREAACRWRCEILATLDERPDLCDTEFRAESIRDYFHSLASGASFVETEERMAKRYQQGVELFTAIGVADRLSQLHFYGGFVYLRLGRPAESLAALYEARQICQDAQLPASSWVHCYIAKEYVNQGRYAEAESCYVTAIQRERARQTSEYLPVFLQAYGAFLHNVLQRYDDALAVMLESEKLVATQEYSDAVRFIASLNVAKTQANAKRYDEAELRCLDLVESLSVDEDKYWRELVALRTLLADLYFTQDQAERAREEYAETKRLIENRRGALDSLDRVQLASLAHAALTEGDMAAAWRYASRHYEETTTYRESQETGPLRRANQLQKIGVKGSVDCLACLALILNKNVDVLQIMEGSRAGALRELATRSRLRIADQLPDKERRRYLAALEEVNQLRSDIERAELQGVSTERLHAELEMAEARYDVVSLKMQEQYERLFAINSTKAISSFRATNCPTLDEQTAVVGWLSYADWLFAFVVRNDDVVWVRLEEDASSKSVAALARISHVLASGKPELLSGELRDELHQVYAGRVAPLLPHLKGVEHLVVVAQGWPAFVPLEMLLTEPPSTGASQIHQWSWLADGYSISYTPSVTMLDILARDSNRLGRWDKDLLVLADPPFDEGQLAQMKQDIASQAVTSDAPAVDDLVLRSTMSKGENLALPRLPGTRYEARAIRRCFDDNASRLLLGPDASEAALFALSEAGELEDYRFVHLATHGYVDEDRPDFSGLMLAQTPRTEGYDGRLQMREVFGLRLKAELVVLSACQTGRGSTIRGEGVVGLQTAFLSSGANALVMSLWNVPDISTALLMRQFYERLRLGDAKAVALRAAKEWLRNLTYEEVEKLIEEMPELVNLSRGFGKVQRSEKGDQAEEPLRPFADPYHWAGFVLTGDFK